MLIKRNQPKTQEDKARELAREREKRRRKMIRTKFGQKQKKHARKGLKSCICAFFAVLMLVLMLSFSFHVRGDVSVLSGIFGFVTAAVAADGVSLAVQGFKERDKNYITCRVGAGINGALLLCICAIFIRGLIR